MKNNPFTRFLSVALTAVMLVGVMPGAVLADAGEAIVGASSAVVESIPESTTPADAAPVATEVPPVTEPEATPETVVEPEASPEVETTPEATEEPEATPEATEQPEATPEATQEPEATPEATEQPEATPEATEEPEATPEATEQPEATPEATEEPETEENDLQQQVEILYEALMNTSSSPQWDAVLAEYSTEELSSLQTAFSQEQLNAVFSHINELEMQEYVPPQSVVFTQAGPFMPPVTVQSMLNRYRSAMMNSLTETNPNDALKYSKTLTEWSSETGKGTIKIEAYATGEYKTEVVEEAVPVDIVLVLDQSGSMAYDFNGDSTWDNEARRQYALKNAVNQFIKSVSEKYSETADHRISIVTFAGGASIRQGWTEVNEAGKNVLTGAINSLPNSPSGATNVGAGMQYAKELLVDNYAYTGDNTTRQKVTIVFTDGVPTTDREFDISVANAAIGSAQSIKSAGATIYTVGIFQGANPSQLHGPIEHSLGLFEIKKDPCTGEVGSVWNSKLGVNWFGDITEQDVPAGNRFLNYLSSNFDYVEEIGIKNNNRDILGIGFFGYEVTKNAERTAGNYYLIANDAAGLEEIFKTIEDNIGSGSTTVTLNADSVIRDIMSPYFDVDITGEGVKVYTVPATGEKDDDGNFVFEEDNKNYLNDAAEVFGDTVEVDGFDFSTHYVTENGRPQPGADMGESYHGEKICIEIPITVDHTATLGGNAIPTNDSASGIYITPDAEEPEVLFDQPAADVKINYGFTTKDASVYLTQGISDLKTLISENAVYDGTTIPVNGSTNQYVNITYTVKDESGTTVGVYEIPAGHTAGSWTNDGSVEDLKECTNYTVVCDVKSVNDPAQDGVENYTGTKTIRIHVFTPKVTWTDSSRDYNTDLTQTLLEEHEVGVDWEDKTHAAAEDPAGEAPTLSYDFGDLLNTQLTAETNVAVTVKIGTQDVTSYVDFDWEKGTDCPETCTEAPENAQFRIHLKNGNLTITKKLDGLKGNDTSATFLFEITGGGKTYYAGITMTADKCGPNSEGESVIIKNLPAGDYTVTEILCPSGYVFGTSDPSDGKVTVSGNGASVTFTNTKSSEPDDPTKDDGVVINQFTYKTEDEGGPGWFWDKFGR